MSLISRIVLNSLKAQTGYKHSFLKTDTLWTANRYASSKGSGNKGSGGQDGDPYNPCDPCEPCCYESCPPNKGCNPSAPTCYDERKFGHKLPVNDVCTYFEPLPNIPTGIFRCTDGEVLGLGASKCCVYKTPEYFSYHHMTYYDLHLIMRCFRKPTPKTGRKP